MTELLKKPPRGRPVTGTAKTSAERGVASEEALRQSGGVIISRLRLSHDAATALDVLTERYGTKRAAIEQALIVAAKWPSGGVAGVR